MISPPKNNIPMKLDPVAKKGEGTSVEGVKKSNFRVPFRTFFKGLEFTQNHLAC